MTKQQDFLSHVEPLRQALYGRALRMTKSHVEAEDLVQDTMARAFRFWDSFVPGSNLKAWMFTILNNTAINGYHRAKRIRTTLAEAAHAPVEIPPSPEDVIQSIRARSTIHDALAELTEEHRQAVVMADLEGLSYKEIAAKIDRPIGTVMSRIHRARKQLRAALYARAEELDVEVRELG